MRRRHLQLVEAPTVTAEEHAQQRVWVELSERLSRFSKERRDEAASQSHLYSSRARERAGNVIPLGRHVPPTDPTRPAA